MNDIHDFLAQLALQRPIFHSEADFQHAFAWELHLVFPEALVRLEYPMLSHGEQIYVDLWAELDDTAIAVELKYKPRGITVLSRGERYTLRDQAAQPINRYYFAKDIQRLEEITLSSDAIAHKKVFRHAVLLTNDSAYWKSPRQPGTTSESFSLHDGHVLSGTLEWGVDTGIGTKKSREDSIQLNGSYFLKWNSYSSFDAKSYGAFRYLAVEILG